MGKIFPVLLFVALLASGCGGGAEKKPNETDVIKYGSVLFTKYGCAVCHSMDGQIVHGPPLNDFYLKEIKVLRKGQEVTITADREYLKNAIENPSYEKVADYKSKAMPQTHLPKKDIEILIDYLIAVNQANQTVDSAK